jgi:O-antigen ligase
VNPTRGWSREQVALALTFAAAAASLVSIAASQILIGAAFVAVLYARIPLRLPSVWRPLLLFFLATIASIVASGHPHRSLPQVKKFYVYLILALVISVAPSLDQIRRLFFVFGAVGALSAFWSFYQFAHKYDVAKRAGRPFYDHYVSFRITGFMSHWMTFSGQEMMVVLLLLSLLVFAVWPERVRWIWLMIAVAGAGLLLAFTRSMWIGAAIGGVYLLWHFRKWAVALVPLAGILLLAANPFDVRQRVVSVFQPRAELDSNRHREITRAVGVEMIKAHPFFGVGPEQVGPQFEDYLAPAGVQKPLPPGYYGHLHNIYYHYGAERGLIALAALLWFFGQMLWDFGRGLRTNPEARFVLHGAIAVLLAIMVSGYWEVNLGDSEVLTFFLAVMGCGYAALRKPLKTT